VCAVEVVSVDRFIDEMRVEFPGFRIVRKETDRLSRLIDLGLRALTLGRQRDYLTRYHTVLGRTLYVPRTWATATDHERLVVLRHERVHLRQTRRFGRLGLAFLYLIPFFPVGLAWGRARLEWEAYEETLRATVELEGPEKAADPALRRRIVDRFVGPDYGWMWPFRRQVERWYDDALAVILREVSTGPLRSGRTPCSHDGAERRLPTRQLEGTE
jgi:hypothetical protein